MPPPWYNVKDKMADDPNVVDTETDFRKYAMTEPGIKYTAVVKADSGPYLIRSGDRLICPHCSTVFAYIERDNDD